MPHPDMPKLPVLPDNGQSRDGFSFLEISSPLNDLGRLLSRTEDTPSDLNHFFTKQPPWEQVPDSLGVQRASHGWFTDQRLGFAPRADPACHARDGGRLEAQVRA
jgi:hypothetical protein